MFKKRETEEVELKPTKINQHNNSTEEEVELKDSGGKLDALFSLPGTGQPSSAEQEFLTSKLNRVIDQNERIISLLEELLRKSDNKNNQTYYDNSFEKRRLW